jgi:hypothetical protein
VTAATVRVPGSSPLPWVLPGPSPLPWVFLPALTAAGWLIGLAAGSRWLLPLLNAAPACWILIATLRLGARRRAIALMMWWGLWLGICGVGTSVLWPARAEMVVLNGSAYRDEMFSWLATGVGREATPAAFIPQHLLHAGVFVALSLLTGSVISLLMGAVLMNYMSFFVGSLILRCAESDRGGMAMLLAWNPWSMVRVASFIILGVVLAEPLLSRMPGSWPRPEGRRVWIAIALAGLALDIVMKTLLAPQWPRLFTECFVP